MTLFDFFIRVFFSVLFGFIIGVERQLTGHIAGIRINVLVSMASCLFVLFSLLMEVPDPSRMGAQVVSGIGFLGTGIIFKDGAQVRGLNTAATIWCTSAIGLLTSTGKIFYAFSACVLLLAANLSLRFVAGKFKPLTYFCGDYLNVEKLEVAPEKKAS